MRRPIIMDEKRLHVGYNEEEIRAFLPRTVRVLENGGARLRSAI
jgi:regulatory protein spx